MMKDIGNRRSITTNTISLDEREKRKVEKKDDERVKYPYEKRYYKKLRKKKGKEKKRSKSK